MSNEIQGGVINYTGVKDLDWLSRCEMTGINLGWLEHDRTCQEPEHDNCDPGDDTTYIGGWYLINGELIINPEAEFSAILNRDDYTIQVVRSDWAMPCRPCSPCYPNQRDLESPDEDSPLAYCLPPDVLRLMCCLPPDVLIEQLRHFVKPL